MIVGSLLLILVAIAFAVLGVAAGSDPLLIGSIVASLLAAMALVIGARQSAASRLATAGVDDVDILDPPPRLRVERERPARQEAADSSGRRTDQGTVYGGTSTAVLDADGDLLVDDEPAGTPIPSQAGSVEDAEPATTFEESTTFEDEYDEDAYDDDDPPDEPPAQYVQPADAARVAQMTTDVLVIDGRPRYHLPGCVHLLGRESEPLPVGEAVELGFTPCSLCEPDIVLLADARRG